MRPAATVCRTVLRQCTLALRLMRQEGSSIDTIEEQPKKAPTPRLVRPAGSEQLNRHQLPVQSEGWRWEALGRT
jgi:hypothetical protein